MVHQALRDRVILLVARDVLRLAGEWNERKAFTDSCFIAARSWGGIFGGRQKPMNYLMRIFAHAKRGAPLEDAGTLSVSPKPERAELVRFQYRGQQVTGIVTLIDPHNWETRPDLIPTIHVQIVPRKET